MVENILGHFGWPVALVAALIIGALVWGEHDNETTRRDAIQACANSANTPACVDQTLKIVKKADGD